jgi:hypothetical protein
MVLQAVIDDAAASCKRRHRSYKGHAPEVQARSSVIGAAKDLHRCCKRAVMLLPTSSPCGARLLPQRAPRLWPHGGAALDYEALLRPTT